MMMGIDECIVFIEVTRCSSYDERVACPFNILLVCIGINVILLVLVTM